MILLFLVSVLRYVPCFSVQLLATINNFYVTPNVMKIPGREEEGRESGERVKEMEK